MLDESSNPNLVYIYHRKLFMVILSTAYSNLPKRSSVSVHHKVFPCFADNTDILVAHTICNIITEIHKIVEWILIACNALALNNPICTLEYLNLG